jgi:hypothetical protein
MKTNPNVNSVPTKASGPRTLKNITEFTLESTSFDGFRVHKQMHGWRFCKYISRKKYGNRSLEVASNALALLVEQISNTRSWHRISGTPEVQAKHTTKYVPSVALKRRLETFGFTVSYEI